MKQYLTFAEILTVRKGMWAKVSSRKHKPLKIFPFGPNSDEVMLYGTVEYGMKDGSSAAKDWGARAHLVKEGSDVKMDFYQVYLVSGFSHFVSVVSVLAIVSSHMIPH